MILTQISFNNRGLHHNFQRNVVSNNSAFIHYNKPVRNVHDSIDIMFNKKDRKPAIPELFKKRKLRVKGEATGKAQEFLLAIGE